MPPENTKELDERKYWHHGFYGITELELLEYKEYLSYSTELPLGKEPPRLDLLIINKRRDIIIENDFGRLFRTHNICEYKGPGDSLSIDDYIKTIGYACLYKCRGKTINERPLDELTVSIFRHTYPRELFRELKRCDAEISEHCPGVYYVEGIIKFPTQIIVTGQLSPKKHAAMRSMTENADEADIRNMLRFFGALSEPNDISNALAALLVSVAANRELFEKIRRDSDMQNILLDLVKDEMDKRIAEGELRGEKRGEIRGEKRGEIKGEKRGAARQAKQTAINLHEMNMDIDFIAKAVSQTSDIVAQWLGIDSVHQEK